MWELRGKSLRVAATICSLAGFLLLGFDQGLMSGIIGFEGNAFARDFNNPDANMQGIITSIYDIGCVVGSIMCYFVGDRYGRKKMILTGGSIMIVGAVILASSYSVGQLIAGRIITGVGNGFNSSTIPVFQSEMAKAGNRGRLLCAQGTVTILGLCIAYWIDYGTMFVESSFQWRFPMAFQAVFAFFLIGMLPLVTETPRWLVFKDRNEEGLEVLARLYDLPSDHGTISQQKMYIEASVRQESEGGPFLVKEFFTGGRIGNFRRICLTIMVMIIQQYLGNTMIAYYAPIVYQNTMGLNRNLSMILGGCTSLTYLVGSIIPLFVIDKFGRRALLMFSSAGLCLCFVMVSILLSDRTIERAYGSCAMIFLLQLFLGCGLLPIPWFYPSEINTTRLRSRAMAIGSAANWMSVFVIVQIAPVSIQNLGWKTFVIFSVFNFCWVPIIYFFFPETANLELEDIDHIFSRGGITGGVWETRGYTVVPGSHLTLVEATLGEDDEKEKESFSHAE